MAVFKPRRFLRLMAADGTNIARDPILIFATLMSIAPAALLVAFMPDMDRAAGSALGIQTLSLYVVPVALMLPAILIGWVTGFLLLEDRDEGLFSALDVTPVGKSGMFAYRVAVTALVTALVTGIAMALISPTIPGWKSALLVALVSANAVICAVILPTIARNKVEGVALSKVTNILAIVPLIAALPSPLRLVAGVFPSYWVGEALIPAAADGIAPPLLVVGGFLACVAWIWLTFAAFSRKIA